MTRTLALVTSLLCGATPVWRSVGSQAGALDSGSAGHLVTIAGTTATFTSPLSDHVGLGDALQYDTNGDGVPDALAFISQRSSETSYGLQDASGAAPVAATATAQWQIFRAYPTLGAALNTHPSGVAIGGNENAAIAAALRNFDTFDGGKNLVASGQRWEVACYDDGTPDDALVWVDAPWATDLDHRIEIFTPQNANEVGVSQRHTGAWGTGYRRTHALHIVEQNVWVDGLSIQQARFLGGPTDAQQDNRIFIAHTQHMGADIRFSRCYGENANPIATAYGRCFDVADDLGTLGTVTTVVRMWNDIGVTRSTDMYSAAFAPNTADDVYVYSCTAAAPNTAHAFGSGDDRGTAKSAVVVNGLGEAPGNTALLTQAAPPFVMSFTAVNDNSITSTSDTTADAGNVLNQMFSFVDAGDDYRLTAADTGARGRGRDLSADAIIAFNDDINGNPRVGAWDVGASQYTAPRPPTVVTNAPSSIAGTSATLNGSATPNGRDTRAWFRWSAPPPPACNDTFGTRAPAAGSHYAGLNGAAWNFAEPLINLTPGTTYGFCAIAFNDAGIAFGAVVRLDTPALDAGPPDSGTTVDGGLDGGPMPDAGPLPDGGLYLAACGCTESSTTALALGLLLVLRALRRRSP